MDNPILLITALAPGFIGIAVNKLLQGNSDSEPLDKGVLKYFLYSAATLLLTELTTAKPLRKILEKQQLTIEDCLYPLFWAILIAIAWELVIRDYLLKCINFVYRKIGRNEIFLSRSMLEDMVADGKKHFLEVQFADGSVINGLVEKINQQENAIILIPEPDWVDDIDVKRFEVQQFIMFDKNIIVKEYDYKTINDE